MNSEDDCLAKYAVNEQKSHHMSWNRSINSPQGEPDATALDATAQDTTALDTTAQDTTALDATAQDTTALDATAHFSI